MTRESLESVMDEILTSLPQYDLGQDPITNEDFKPSETYAIYPELAEAKSALISQVDSYVEERERLARVDELERLYLVYGSKDKPASLDNIFSLGKKGEVCATPITKRLEALRQQVKGKRK